MASPARSRIQTVPAPKLADKLSAGKAQEDFLASVMVAVSTSLEAMSEEERERAVVAAEKSVAHLQ